MFYNRHRNGGDPMSFRYNKLWKLLIDRGMNKTELRKTTGIGTTTLAKLSSNEQVSLDVLGRICAALGVQPGDIMEYVEDEQQTNMNM
jgi:DNA-binding Xre family transcriptional regulator